MTITLAEFRAFLHLAGFQKDPNVPHQILTRTVYTHETSNMRWISLSNDTESFHQKKIYINTEKSYQETYHAGVFDSPIEAYEYLIDEIIKWT